MRMCRRLIGCFLSTYCAKHLDITPYLHQQYAYLFSLESVASFSFCVPSLDVKHDTGRQTFRRSV